MHSIRHGNAMMGDGRGLTRHVLLRWVLSGLFVLSVYGAVFAGLLQYRAEPEHLAGSPPAIMLEFAVEPTAPVTESIAETLQQQVQQLARAEPEPMPEPVVQETETEPVKTPPSDFTERQKSKQKHQRTDNKPGEKPERKRRDRQHKKSEQKGVVGPRDQKASAPDVAAQNGKTFAGRYNSRSDGFNGKSNKAWADRVHRRIQSIGRRMERQLPGAHGIAYIAFSYDGAGRILATRVSHSSGNEKLDQLALRIVENSSPLPIPPDAGKKIIPIRVN